HQHRLAMDGFSVDFHAHRLVKAVAALGGDVGAELFRVVDAFHLSMNTAFELVVGSTSVDLAE
ncbi:MAG: hypothetical protein NDI87_05375, partial [Rhodoferax sp.]|nr:hypothetical protein [Rhodoferax sp.]